MPLRRPSAAFFPSSLTTRGATRGAFVPSRPQYRQNSTRRDRAPASSAWTSLVSGPINVSSKNEPPKRLTDIYSQDKGIQQSARVIGGAGIICKDGPLERLKKNSLGLVRYRYGGGLRTPPPKLVRPDSYTARLAKYPRQHQKAIKDEFRKKTLREKGAMQQDALPANRAERGWNRDKPTHVSKTEASQSQPQVSGSSGTILDSGYTVATGGAEFADELRKSPYNKQGTAEVDNHLSSEKEKQKHLLTSILDIYSEQESKKPSTINPNIVTFEEPPHQRPSTGSTGSTKSQYLPGTEQNPSSRSPVSGSSATIPTSLPTTYRDLFDRNFGSRPKSMSTMASQKKASASIQQYKLIFTCPTEDINKVKDAVFETGAGTYPGDKYSRVSFDIQGRGQFTPIGDANPAIGEVGKVEHVDEIRCEIFCGSKDIARNAVKALIKAHPYEQVAYEVYEMVDILADDVTVD